MNKTAKKFLAVMLALFTVLPFLSFGKYCGISADAADYSFKLEGEYLDGAVILKVYLLNAEGFMATQTKLVYDAQVLSYPIVEDGPYKKQYKKVYGKNSVMTLFNTSSKGTIVPGIIFADGIQSDEDFVAAAKKKGITIDNPVTTSKLLLFTVIFDVVSESADSFSFKMGNISYKLYPCEHENLIRVKAKSATCTTNGRKACWKCEDCGCYFIDSDATKITTLSKLKIAATGHEIEQVINKATLSKNGAILNKCSVCGYVESKKTIVRADYVTLYETTVTYNGKTQKPNVDVYDANDDLISDKYYTVSYKNNKNVGEATITVKFKGKYSDSIDLNFTIVPSDTGISKVTSTKKATATVTVKKQATQTTGYEIQYSTSSKFTAKTTKTVKITSAKTLTKTISKLTSGKTYYFRVRTYKTVSKVDYTSAWSTSVKAKIK